MDRHLNHIQTDVYKHCALVISDFEIETESKGYGACRFNLSGRNIISRNAKITPKKVGQFVTFWKRHKDGLIEPFNVSDPLDFYLVNVQKENMVGQFVFPKSILIKKGIISTEKKEGKRAFRVYPAWDLPKSAQAAQTQKWQLGFFYQINASMDFSKVAELYKNDS